MQRLYFAGDELTDGHATLSANRIPISRSSVLQLRWDVDDEEYNNNAE